MKRKVLRKVAVRVAAQIEASPEEWQVRQDYPVTWEESTAGGTEVQIEVQLLEMYGDKMHLAVSVSTGGLSAWSPPTFAVLI